MCLNTGTPKKINFSFQTNGKLMALGVPILKHFRVNLEKMHCKHASAQSHEDFTTKKIGMSLNHKYAYEQEV